ncbi:hypothetical protein Syun_023990 [Stephania yunnanensis]|uniref:RRM domain-containing protein n=1 Tax=Stephania yunnanensis TaxID=152371 RepID=A0AAP0FQW8_9MAGN
MLSSVGSLAKPINSTYALDLLSHKFAAFPLINPTKPPLTTIHSVSSFSQGRRELAIFAKKSRGRANEEVLEMDGSDDDCDYDEEEDDGDDDEGEFVPFPNTSRWFQNKPSGFGKGRVYDTEIEDKLFEEIQQSRRAQLANINKLKNSTPLKGGSQKELQLKKAAEVVSGATRVRVSNLPKKRNIHKDLQLAFKGFPGILNISPVVSANKKTRDPICKGFAFVDLAYEEDATRFKEAYSRKSITFGRIQKQIRCEIMDLPPPNTLSSTCDRSAEVASMSVDKLIKMEENSDVNLDMGDCMSTPDGPSDNEENQDGDNSSAKVASMFTEEKLIKMKESLEANLGMDDYTPTPEGSTGNEENEDADFDSGEFSLNVPQESTDFSDPSVSANLEEIEEDISQLDLPDSEDNIVVKPSTVHETNSLSTKQQKGGRKDKKSMIAGKKPVKVPKKFAVIGSAKRLKMKEKAILTGVLSKYGSRTPASSTEES